MSATYVGPFGRILPLPAHDEPVSYPRSTRNLDSKMVSHTLPVLPVTSKLNFGSDNKTLGFTDPTRYENLNNSQRSHMSAREDLRDKLPPVSQLLTPGPQPGVVSPFNFSQSSATASQAEPRIATTTSHNGVSHNSHYPRHESHYFQAPYTSPRPIHPQYTYQSRQTIHTDPNPAQYQNFQPSQSYTTQTAYRDSQTPQPRHTPHPSTSSSISPHWYPPPPSYNGIVPNPHPATTPSLSTHHGSNVKPLPKFLREENIPGEGVCYIYEDGSRVKKVIDGEVVNAIWGITKAGKPRKRLAVACMTCREKKIKCDPNEPKCLQCDKSGRECRFQSAVRGQHNSPNTHSYEQQARTPSSMTALHFDSLPSPSIDHTEAAASDYRNSHKSARLSSTKRLRGSDGLDDASKLVTKRLRLSNSETETQYLQRPREPEAGAITSTETRNLPLTPSEDMSDVVGSHDFDAHVDPCSVDLDLTLHYMDLFFLHVNAGSYRLFPPKAFLQWMQTEKRKSLSELSVVYAMLALGSVYSSREDRSTDGRMLARIAELAIERTRERLDLQLVQTRLLLALYHSAVGDQVRAAEFCALAVNAMACLDLGLDQKSVAGDGHAVSDFGLDGSPLVECHRRTYWSVFLLDRYLAYRTDRPPILQKEDIHARLPCSDDIYDSQTGAPTPFFDNGIIDQRLTFHPPASPPSIMACEINIATLWSDVTTYVRRWRHAAPHSYTAHYHEFYAKMTSRLNAWISDLPPSLQFSVSNIHTAVRHGNSGSLLAIHSIHYLTAMIFNRCFRRTLLPEPVVRRNVQSAVKFAQEYLSIIKTTLEVVGSTRHSTGVRMTTLPHPHFSAPIISHALLYALDILSEAGSFEPSCFLQTMSLMDGGLNVLNQQPMRYPVSDNQKRTIEKRFQYLTALLHGKQHSKRAWVVTAAIHEFVDVDGNVSDARDEFVSWRVGRLLDALGFDVRDDEIVLIDDGAEKS